MKSCKKQQQRHKDNIYCWCYCSNAKFKMKQTNWLSATMATTKITTQPKRISNKLKSFQGSQQNWEYIRENNTRTGGMFILLFPFVCFAFVSTRHTFDQTSEGEFITSILILWEPKWNDIENERTNENALHQRTILPLGKLSVLFQLPTWLRYGGETLLLMWMNFTFT